MIFFKAQRISTQPEVRINLSRRDHKFGGAAVLPGDEGTSARMRVAAELAGIGVFEWDCRTDEILCEPGPINAILNRCPEDPPLERRRFLRETLHPSDRRAFLAAVGEALRGGGTCSVICRIRVGGSWRKIRLQARGVMRHDAVPRSLIGTVQLLPEVRSEAGPDASCPVTGDDPFRILAEATPSIAFLLASDGHSGHANARWVEYFGASFEEVLGGGWWECVHPEDREQVVTRWHDCVQRGADFEHEFRVRRRDGEMRWHLGRAEPLRSDDGREIGRCCTLTDIHALKTAEKALSRQRELMAAILDNIPVLLCIWDPQLRSFEFNQHLRDVLGWTEEDTLDGRFIEKVYPDRDYRREVSEFMLSLKSGWRDLKTTGKDGRAVDISWANIRLEGGTLIGIGVDVRQRKRQEEALRLSNERYQLVAEATNDVIWDWDLVRDRIEWNLATRDHLGVEPEALSSDSAAWFERIHPDDLERIRSSIEHAIHGSARSWAGEYRFRRSDGSYAVFFDRGHIARDADGRVYRMIGSMLNVTDRRQTEDALAAAKQAAEEANASKSEFLANMSHEIRTPMTAILGFTDILERKLKAPELKEHVRVIAQNGRFLLELINDILDLSRIEAGQLAVQRERFAPDVFLREVCAMMEMSARSRSLSLQLQIEGPLPETIESDPTRLRQILVNLLGNAVKFTEKGTVRLVVRFLPEASRLRFDVVDTGLGIAPELRDLIFEPFRQADASITRNFGGSGLGLTISQRMALLLGGRISCESVPGKGSTFTLEVDVGDLRDVALLFPAADATFRIEAAPEKALPALDCTVLIVEDQAEIFDLERHWIEDVGGRVIGARNGREGVDTWEARREAGEPVDLILMDVQMPGMDGCEATRRLRASGYEGPVVAITASAMKGDREKCLDAGCNECLTKPIDVHELLGTIQRLTTRKARGAARGAAAEDGPPVVLVVEDDVNLSRLLAMLIEAEGWRTVVARSGKEALRLAVEVQPAVVLMDLGLPDMDGFDLLPQVQERLQSREIRYIALSGRDEPGIRAEALAAGFNHYLLKPPDFAELMRHIAAAAASAS